MVGRRGGRRGRRGKKFASGGYVHGPSHSQGGVPAELEGGEYVIPKGYAGGGRIKVGIGKQDYAGMFLQPSGPDQVPGPQTTYTGTLRESGKIAAMINAGGIRSTSGRATNKRGKSPLSGKPHIGVRGNLGTSISRDPAAGLIDPLQDGGDIAFGNTKKTVGIGKSTFLRAARKAGIFSGPEVDTMRGRGVGVNWKSLSSSQKQRSKTLIAQLGGTLQPGKGYKGVKAEEVGTTIPLVGQPSIFAIDPHHEKDFKQRLRRHWDAMLDETAQVDLDSVAPGMKDMIFERAGGKAVEGHAFEAMLLAFSKQGGFSKSSTEDFDMRGGMGSKSDFAGAVSHLFDPKDLLTQFKWLDAKRSISGDTKASLVKKGANTAAMDPSSGIRLVYEEGGKKTLLRAAGGNVFSPQGTDTVPAMLTPGEFVINRKSAQKIGYGNLKSMNNYATGGKVQYLKGGGKTTGGGDVVGGDAMGMVFGIQMAVGALAGFTAALAGFDLNAPMTSIMALGMAALQAAGSFALLAPGLGGTLMATKGMKGVMEKLKKPFQDLAKPFKECW